jgi:hypothetical protein
MDTIGAIRRRPQRRGFSFQAWRRLVDRHPELVPAPHKVCVNKTTGKRVSFPLIGYATFVVVDGRKVGKLRWAPGGDELFVSGAPDAVVQWARAYAAELGGKFTASPPGSAE